MFLINKTHQFILIVLILFFLTATSSHSEQSFGDYEGAIYVRNYDGDTVTFNLPKLHPIIGKNIRVRLNGIDTPEIRGKCDKEKYDAEQAREMVGDILRDAKQIDLKNMQRGKYFRIVADIYVDGENLAEALIDSGMAVKYDGGKKNSRWCE